MTFFPPILAALPDTGYLILAAVVVAIVAIVGIGIILSFGKKLVADLASVVKNEISAQREPTRMDVQQPLVVTAHQEAITRAELEKVDTQLHGRLKRERIEIDAEIARVAAASEKRTDELAGDLKDNTALTQKMSGEVSLMNQSIQALNSSLTNFLRDQANRGREASR